MQGQDKLIDEILQSAKKTAVAMVDEASAEQEASVAALREELDAEREKADAATQATADSVYAGLVKLGELEANKISLKAKQDCVAAVYAAVREKVLALKDAAYLKLLEKLIAGACEDGDEIVPAQADAKRVTAAWVKKLSTKLHKKLTLAKKAGSFDGGVILRNSRYDRDLSIDELIADLKEKTESETVKALGL